MKNIILCIALTGTLSLQAGAQDLAKIPTPESLQASFGESSASMYCIPTQSKSEKATCFATEAELHAYSREEDAKLTAFILKARKDNQIRWQRNQQPVSYCTERTSVNYCPQEGESIESYTTRVIQLSIITKFEPPLSTEELLKNKFWDRPWSIQRHLLAVNIKLGLLGSNDVLPVSKRTPLDHAAERLDLEMMLFLAQHGAHPYNMKGIEQTSKNRFVISDGYRQIIIYLIKSPDERSAEIMQLWEVPGILGVLKGGYTDYALYYLIDAAKDQSPELVERKARLITRLSPSCHLQIAYGRITGASPGEVALKNLLYPYTRWSNCLECAIL